MLVSLNTGLLSRTGRSTAANTASADRAAALRKSLAYVLLATLAYVLPLIIYRTTPVTYVWLVTEDSFAEWGTVVAWLGVAVVTVALLVRVRELRGPGMIALIIVAILLAGEEMSWGQRVFGIAPPEFFKSHNRQGELNLHNLVLNSRFDPINFVIAVWSFVVSPIALAWAPARSLMTALAVPIVPLYLAPCFLVALAYVTMAGIPAYLTSNATEVGEFYLAVAALLLVVHIASTRRRSTVSVMPLAIALATLALVGVLSEAATARFPDVLQLRARLLQFAVFGYPKDGKDEQAARLYDYSEAHPDLIDHGIGAYSVTGGTRIEHARLLLRLGQEAKARDVLGEALEFLDDPAHVRPQDAVAAERSRGVILKLLGREQEAATALRAAVAADEANLAVAKNAEAEAWVHWSLAKTYVAAGQLDVALKETRIAYDRTPDAGLRKTITDWARNNVPPGL